MRAADRDQSCRSQERELEEADQTDAQHLAQQQLPRPHRGQQDLDDAVRLLLDDARGDDLAVYDQRRVEQCGHEDADHGLLRLQGRIRVQVDELDRRMGHR